MFLQKITATEVREIEVFELDQTLLEEILGYRVLLSYSDLSEIKQSAVTNEDARLLNTIFEVETPNYQYKKNIVGFLFPQDVHAANKEALLQKIKEHDHQIYEEIDAFILKMEVGQKVCSINEYLEVVKKLFLIVGLDDFVFFDTKRFQALWHVFFKKVNVSENLEKKEPLLWDKLFTIRTMVFELFIANNLHEFKSKMFYVVLDELDQMYAVNKAQRYLLGDQHLKLKRFVNIFFERFIKNKIMREKVLIDRLNDYQNLAYFYLLPNLSVNIKYQVLKSLWHGFEVGAAYRSAVDAVIRRYGKIDQNLIELFLFQLNGTYEEDQSRFKEKVAQYLGWVQTRPYDQLLDTLQQISTHHPLLFYGEGTVYANKKYFYDFLSILFAQAEKLHPGLSQHPKGKTAYRLLDVIFKPDLMQKIYSHERFDAYQKINQRWVALWHEELSRLKMPKNKILTSKHLSPLFQTFVEWMNFRVRDKQTDPLFKDMIKVFKAHFKDQVKQTEGIDLSKVFN